MAARLVTEAHACLTGGAHDWLSGAQAQAVRGHVVAAVLDPLDGQLEWQQRLRRLRQGLTRAPRRYIIHA
jgi:hypothetical protein